MTFMLLETATYPSGKQYVVLGFEEKPVCHADVTSEGFIPFGTRKPRTLEDAIVTVLKRKADALEHEAREARYRYNRAIASHRKP